MSLEPILKPWTEAEAGDILAIVGDYDDLIAALRRRADAAGFSYSSLEDRTGLQKGYCAKLFGPARARNLGPLSMRKLLRALKLKIVIVAEEQPVPLKPKARHRDRAPLPSAEIDAATTPSA
jgi:cyanate lyase